jgi:hypothetical protein
MSFTFTFVRACDLQQVLALANEWKVRRMLLKRLEFWGTMKMKLTLLFCTKLCDWPTELNDIITQKIAIYGT